MQNIERASTLTDKAKKVHGAANEEYNEMREENEIFGENQNAISAFNMIEKLKVMVSKGEELTQDLALKARDIQRQIFTYTKKRENEIDLAVADGKKSIEDGRIAKNLDKKLLASALSLKISTEKTKKETPVNPVPQNQAPPEQTV